MIKSNHALWRQSWQRLAQLWLAGAAALAVTAAHAVNDLPGGPAVNQLDLHPPVTRIAAEQQWLHYFMMVICAVIFVVVFGVMFWLWKSRRLSGRLVFVYFGLYAVMRFFLEFTRDNETAFWGLTIAQVVSLTILGVGAVAFLCIRPRAP